jgi:16S rRNA (cytosine967-C5)-methyltransferase
MTPAARLSAAIELLDAILAGEPAERTLTRWARASRFAGSKDRAAVRDVVFDCLRQRRSLGFLGGGDSGRSMVLAHAATQDAADAPPLDALFTGEGFDPAPVTASEQAALGRDLAAAPRAVRLDVPDFLEAELEASLGEAFEPVMLAMRDRAPVDLRVNTLKTNARAAMVVLARDGVLVEPHPLAPAALRVVRNPRQVAQSRAYTQGMVELQDVSSQSVAAASGAAPGMTVLDFCAGGGGKTLALAAAMEGRGRLIAHDAHTRRMKDLPDRARRAGAAVEILGPDALHAAAPRCDLVFVDAPCSGTGAWRRTPEGKWRLRPADLGRLARLQDDILAEAAGFVRPGGGLVYATCSLLDRENRRRIEAFLADRPGWRVETERSLNPLDGGDGFYVARLKAP